MNEQKNTTKTQIKQAAIRQIEKFGIDKTLLLCTNVIDSVSVKRHKHLLYKNDDIILFLYIVQTYNPEAFLW